MSWNWTAALFTTPWLAYNRRGTLAVMVLASTIAVVFLTEPYAYTHRWAPLMGQIASTVVFGLFGSRLNRPERPSRISGAVMVPFAAFALFLSLVAASQTTHDTKDKGYRTQMIADLASFRWAESTAFARSGRFTARPPGFDSTYMVSWPRLAFNRDSTGYTAIVSHGKLPGLTCAIGVHMPNPVDPTKPDGEYACKK